MLVLGLGFRGWGSVRLRVQGLGLGLWLVLGIG